jgi:hypothetical protein
MYFRQLALLFALTSTVFGAYQAEAQDNAPVAEAQDPGQKTEWVSVGYTYSTALGEGHGLNIGGPVLKWGSLYWQTAELVSTSPRGDIYPEYVDGASRISIATIAGYRLPTSSDGRHELRAGLGAGWMLQDVRADGFDKETGLPEAAGSCANGSLERDYYGLGLLPEFGWFWRMAPGVGPPFLNFVQAKFRLLVPVLALNKHDPADTGGQNADGEGIQITHCEGTDCPWRSAAEPWTPGVSLSFSLAVGF